MTSYYCPMIIPQVGYEEVYYISPFNLKMRCRGQQNGITVEIPYRDLYDSVDGAVYSNQKCLRVKRGLKTWDVGGLYVGASEKACWEYVEYLETALMGRAADNKFCFFPYYNDSHYEGCWSEGLEFTVNNRVVEFSFQIITDKWNANTLYSISFDDNPFEDYLFTPDTGGEITMPTKVHFPIMIAEANVAEVTAAGEESKVQIYFPTGVTSLAIKRIQIVAATPNPAGSGVGSTTYTVNKTGVGGSGDSASASVGATAKQGTYTSCNITVSAGDSIYLFCSAAADHTNVKVCVWLEA